MSSPTQNQILNQLLIELGWSMLHYVSKASPWTDETTAAAGESLESLWQEQSRQVEMLTELLQARDWTIESGAYPTEYTDLQYLSLDFLLGPLALNAKSLLARIKESLPAFHDDETGTALLEEVLASQRNIVNRLEKLASVGSNVS